MSASEKLKALDGRRHELANVHPQIVAVVEDGENAIEQAILFVERHIEEDHAKPLLAVLKGALARFAALDEALT